MKRWIAAALWVGLLIAMVAAPPQREDMTAWLIDLATGNWAGTEPWVVAHFNLMGVFPMLLLLQLRGRLGSRPLPLWPFALGSFALGGYALLPWFVLAPATTTERSWAWLDRVRVPGAVLGILCTLGLVGWAAFTGSWSNWAAIAASDGFVFPMSWDFLALWITTALLARDRGGRWWLTAIPVLGTALYLLVEPPPADPPKEA